MSLADLAAQSGDPAALAAVGLAVRSARRAAGLTQQELASRAGISRLTISHLETGRLREMGYRSLLRVLRSLKLDFRLTTYNHGRPTLDDLVVEEME